MTCNDCIHRSVCYMTDYVPSNHARKCGDFESVCKTLEQEPCEDAISRQSAISLASDLKQDLPDDEHMADMVMVHNEGILEYQTQLSLLPSVTPQPKWIPVSERLPEKSDRYLAYIVNRHDDKLQYIMTCDYSVDGYWNWFPDAESASDNVIAWMPLPTPYKPQESEE